MIAMRWIVLMALLAYSNALDLDNAPSNVDLLKLIQRLNSTVGTVISSNAYKQGWFFEITASGPRIGFFARLEGKDVLLGLNQAIIFNTVITNIGNGYDARHGHFTAPVSGLYQFVVAIMTLPNKTLIVNIVKNGALVDYVYASGSSYISTSKTVIISLNMGDMVWVREPGDSYVGEMIHEAHSTFSGNLISTL